MPLFSKILNFSIIENSVIEVLVLESNHQTTKPVSVYVVDDRKFNIPLYYEYITTIIDKRNDMITSGNIIEFVKNSIRYDIFCDNFKDVIEIRDEKLSKLL